MLLYIAASIRDTLNVPLNHAFGAPIPWSEYGVGDLLHMRPVERYQRGRQYGRSLIAIVRNQLKKANFHSFDNLLHAFKFYDKANLLLCVFSNLVE
jgi:hypothetical protein